MEILIEGIRSGFLFSVILRVICISSWLRKRGGKTTLFDTENLPVCIQGGGSSVTCRTKTQVRLYAGQKALVFSGKLGHIVFTYCRLTHRAQEEMP